MSMQHVHKAFWILSRCMPPFSKDVPTRDVQGNSSCYEKMIWRKRKLVPCYRKWHEVGPHTG